MNHALSNGKSIGFWSVVAIGVGGMVGGGIFAVLGLAVQLARGGTPIAFAMAGAVALITSYSYAKLSVAYPTQGGTVEFLNQAFGPGLLTGGINVLLWSSYVIMLSLYAYAFGSYGAALFPVSVQPVLKHILISGIVVLLTGLNVLGAKVVGETEEGIVGFKIVILLLFIAVGIGSIKILQLKPSTWSHPLQLISGGMIIFLAYEGFELIANTAGDVKNPGRTLPRAYYTAVGFVIALYVFISMVAVGNLPVARIVGAKDYALAVAAQPFLGSFGFILIAIAALLSTSSAINATIYGASRISYIIAKEGELPEGLEKKIWDRPIEGLLITSALTLVVANLFDLSSISMMGSSGFLFIFMAVNVSNFKLHKKTASRRSISALGAIMCLVALGLLILQAVKESPKNIFIVLLIFGLSFAVEGLYQKFTGRMIRPFFRNGKRGEMG
jgi:amino acid transporter